ncbi:hypothetical protein OE88DRAFT_1729062 [Heliocybe sulcata]|uniref:DUF6699 domain-containing protein n=1 Tax=Heliocybe sulcata TaxID=5364 RepID=A0A5C3MP07_9AGAM|nr:hypothetical protein OE88DRAFT_1729062 [Heliocybe sulcata]
MANLVRSSISHGEALRHFTCLNAARSATLAAASCPRPCPCRDCGHKPIPGGWIPPEDRPVASEQYRDPVTGACLQRPRRRSSARYTPAHRTTRPSRSILRGLPDEPQTPLTSRGGFNPGITSPAPLVMTTPTPLVMTTPSSTPYFFISPVPTTGTGTSPLFLTGHLSPSTSSPFIPSPAFNLPAVDPFIPPVIPDGGSPPCCQPAAMAQAAAYASYTLQPSLPPPSPWLCPPPQPPWTPSFPAVTPAQTYVAVPTATPAQTPNQIVYVTPSGNLTWTPHPQPHPQIPPAAFFPMNAITGSNPAAFSPVWDPNATMSVSGGYPLPGTSPNWTTPPWPPVSMPGTEMPMRIAPCLIPNPVNALLPQIVWDVSKSPSTARKITGRHIILDMVEDFKQPATAPTVQKLVIVCDFGALRSLWPQIEIEQDGPITVWDVMNAIYEFFQKRLRKREVEFIQSLQPGNEAILRDSFYRRCQDSPGLYEWEVQQGYKRVDVLGDSRVWWGVWVTYNPDDTWQLNLGLMPLRQP